MDGPNTFKGWNELIDYLQTNIAMISYTIDIVTFNGDK